MIDIKGYSLKNSLDEWTIEEYEKITEIMNREELENIEKYMDAMKCLGLSDEILDELTFDDFFDLIQEFKFTQNAISMQSQIIIDGYRYVAYEGEEFNLKVKDLSLIERAVIQQPNSYLSRAMAIIFKRDDLTKAEHYAEAHLKEKVQIFKQQKASLAYPYLVHLTEKLNKKLNVEVSTKLV